MRNGSVTVALFHIFFNGSVWNKLFVPSVTMQQTNVVTDLIMVDW